MEVGSRGRLFGAEAAIRPRGDDVLKRTFSLWLRHLAPLAATAAAIWVPTYLLELLLAGGLGLTEHLATVRAVTGRLSGNGGVLSPTDAAALQSVVAAVGLYVLVSLILTWAAVAASQAALIRATADADSSGRVDIRAALAAVPASFGRLLIAWAVTFAILLGAVALVIAVGAVLMLLAGFFGAGVLIIVVLGLVVLGATLVPLAVFSRLALAPPLIILEGASAIDSLRLSNRLLRSHFAMVFAVLIVLGVIGWLGTQLFSLPGSLAGGGAQLPVNVAFKALGVALLAPIPQVGLTVIYRSVRSSPGLEDSA